MQITRIVEVNDHAVSRDELLKCALAAFFLKKTVVECEAFFHPCRQGMRLVISVIGCLSTYRAQATGGSIKGHLEKLCRAQKVFVVDW